MEHRQLKKIVFGYADETCPAVDAHFDNLIDELSIMCGGEDDDLIVNLTQAVDVCRELVKADGTIRLRDAMFVMAGDMQDLEVALEEARHGD